MKALIRMFAWSIGVLILTVGVLAALFWDKRTVWPEFPVTNDPTPQVVTRLEPDFAWRTGDKVPVTIFIKQKPNVTVDLNSLAIEGDFELAGAPELYVRDTKSGDKYLRINLNLQSFNPRLKLGMKANMSYTVVGDPDPKVVNVPGLELYTSRTWDGRPARKDGPMAVVHGWHMWITGLALALGVVGAIGALIYIANVKRQLAAAAAEPLKGKALARHRFAPIWERIRRRQDGEDDYKEIERIIRNLFRFETKVSWEIPLEIGDGHPHVTQVVALHQLCCRVLYQGETLSDPEKREIRRLFDEITLPRKAAVKPAQPAAKAPTAAPAQGTAAAAPPADGKPADGAPGDSKSAPPESGDGRAGEGKAG